MAKESKTSNAAKNEKDKPTYEQLEETIRQLSMLVEGYRNKADQLEVQMMLSKQGK
tara:strand:+ start:16294 stop:16461 length:168 start_codon:yes stop_codon:yes gene_type:complete